MRERYVILGALLFLAAGAAGPFLPFWFVSLLTITMANAMVVLGLMLLWRAGLVSFGQALYFAIGAYSVALIMRWTGITDAILLVAVAALAAGAVACLVGFLLARYREIFFAMLSLALSMILYGMLVNTEALGSTDGFNVRTPSFLGYAPRGFDLAVTLYWFAIALSAIVALLVSLYLRSVAGFLAVPVRDNEIRVEYLGVSVNRLVHLKIVIAGVLGGIGGAIAALAISHVDPNMSYWTTSGSFVFITILAGASSVAAAFVGAILFEVVRTTSVALLPGAWQLILGTVLLATILFLPGGIGSLFSRRRKRVRGEEG